MSNYVTTGMLPNYSGSPLLYVDDVNKPSFEETHDVITYARQRFDTLPTSLKNELGNDYRKFDSWISNPDNAHRAEKLGLLHIRKPQLPKADPEGTPLPKQEPANPV